MTTEQKRKRGRPRDPKVDQSIHAAAQAVLLARGYAALTIEEVAARAGVSKTTIYRRWPSKGDMVFAAVFGEERLAPSTVYEDLLPNLVAVLSPLVELLSAPAAAAAFPGLLVELRSNEALAERFRNGILGPEIQGLTALLEKAMSDDLLCDGFQPELFIDVLLGAVLSRSLIVNRPLDQTSLTRLAEYTLFGALKFDVED